MNKTSISWTDFTSSPIKPVERGWMCAKVSTGCEHCYSEALNMRYGNKKSFNAVNLSNMEFRIDEDEIKRIKKVPSGSKVFLQDMTDIFNEKILGPGEEPGTSSHGNGAQCSFQMIGVDGHLGVTEKACKPSSRSRA